MNTETKHIEDDPSEYQFDYQADFHIGRVNMTHSTISDLQENRPLKT